MNSNVCGAIKSDGQPCHALRVVGGKRCRHHGGLSTGPRTPMGRLLCGNGFRAYRGPRGGKPGHRKTDKARLRREARARRAARLPAMIERQRRRALRWEAKKRLRAGLPLLTEVEIENFGADPENKD